MEQRDDDEGREAAADDAGQRVGERGAGVAHRGRELLGDEGALRPVHDRVQGQADHDREDHESRHLRVEHGEQPERPERGARDADPVYGASPETVGQEAGERDRHGVDGGARQDGGQRQGAGQVQDGRHVGQAEDHRQAVMDVRSDPGASGDQQAAPVQAQHVADRRLRLGVLGFQRLEHRRFLDAAADPEAEGDQRHAADEGQAPPPREEVRVARRRGDEGDRRRRDQGAGGRAHLRPRGVEAAPVLPAVLHREQHGAGPLAAERDALHEAQGDQQGRAQHADGGVGRQQAHRRRRHAHDDEGDEEDGAAPDPVAEAAEDDAAERTRQVADRVGREGEDGAGDRIEGGEEQVVEDQRRHGVVDGEIIPFQRGADHARAGEPPHPYRCRRRERVVRRHG